MDADASSGLDDVADELYGLLPEAFTAERDARASRLRSEGDRELAAQVKALRRPAVAAWLVNALVRHRGDEIEQLLTLGETLRQAQADMDAGQLRELGRQRQGLVAAVGRQSRALARELGRAVTDPVVDAVEETLRAALSDGRAADAVRSGRLTAPLSYAGFGEVDLSDALATPRPRPLARRSRSAGGSAGRSSGGSSGGSAATAAPAPAPDADELRRARARAALAAARSARVAAEGAARRAGQHRDAVVQRAATARQRVDAAQGRVEELEQVLAEARTAAERARSAWTPLQADADAASDAARHAETDVDAARRAEDAARDDLVTAGGTAGDTTDGPA